MARKVLFLFASLCLGIFPFAVKAQWYVVSDTLKGRIADLYFVNSETGFAVGDSGIFKTTDGGSSWEQFSFPATSDEQLTYARSKFKAVYFCPSLCSKGYAVGYDTLLNQGVCYETADNGVSWQLFHPVSDPPDSWNDIVIVNNTLFLGGSGGRFIIKHPFNPVWTEAFEPPQGDIQAIWFSGASAGGLAATNEGLFYSMDIGESWVKVGEGSYADVAASFTKGFAIQAGLISRANPPTSTGFWEPVFQLPDSVEARRLALNGFNINSISLGTGNGIYRHITDSVWELQPSSNGYSIRALFYVNANLGYAAADNGILLKTTNAGGPTLPYANFNNHTSGCVMDSAVFTNLGYSGNTFTWRVNGAIIPAPQEDLHWLFDTAGLYQVSLEGSNGDFTNTFSQTIYISDTPDSLLVFEAVQDTLCTGDAVWLRLDSSQADVDYFVFYGNTTTPFDTLNGNGNTLLFNAGPADSSAWFSVWAQHRLSGCGTPLLHQASIVTRPPILGQLAFTQRICSGDTLVLSSRPGLSYTWSPLLEVESPNSASTRIFPSFNTDYTVEVSLPYCPAFTDTFRIEVQQPPVPFIIQIGDTLFAEPSDAAVYIWYFNDQQLEGASTYQLALLGEGSYHVVIGDSLGCTAVSPALLVTSILAPTPVSCRVFPNPTSRSISLQVPADEQIQQVKIYDSQGWLVFQKVYATGHSNLQISVLEALPQGCFFIRLSTFSGKQWIGSFIKK